MTAARTDRTRRRLGALVLALSAALLPTAGLAGTVSTASADEPSPSPSANDDAPAQILITTLAPRAPLNPDDFFQVRGTVVNRGSQPLHGLTVRLRRGEKLSSRSELATADTDPPATPTRVGRTPVRTVLQDLAPGRSTTFDIRIRVAQLQLYDPRPGVYPLRVEARGQVGDNGPFGPVGNVLTYVPWLPDGPPTGKVRIAWLWPVVDQPRRAPREVMLDTALATSFRRGGRLDRMVRAAADGAKGGRCDEAAQGPPTLPARPRTTSCRADAVPVTYAVDPDLLYTANALTSPYQLLETATRTRRIDDTGPARTWLDALRSATSNGDVLSLPYADPDVVALTAPDSGLADEVPLLGEVGKQQTTKTLDRTPLDSVVWPPTGRLTRRAVESLTAGGATAVVVDPVALPPPATEPSRTPDADVGALSTSTGSPALLTTDTQLSQLLLSAPLDYPGDRVIEQRWLAETAMISAEAPSVARTILVAPPRGADLHPAVAADAIRDSGRLPWMCAVPLASVAAHLDRCNGETSTSPVEQPSVELEPVHDGDPLLSKAFLSRVRALRRVSTQFTDEVLAKPTSPEAAGTASRLVRARARTESRAWRDSPSDGERMLALLADDLRDLRGKVHLQVGSGTVTLTSTSGVISVNVVNELDQPVLVGVALNPGSSARLSTRKTPITTVGPGRATQINLKVTAQTSGSFPVKARLVDHDGKPFGPEVTLVVRSTKYGRVALAVTGIAAGVLLAAAGIRIVRRAMHRPGASAT